MNKLAPVGEDAWHLEPHARLVVYDRRERELVTIYDCGVAQAPPRAQLLGHLVRIAAEAEIERTPTGYAASMREPAVLERQAGDRYVVRPRGD